VEWIASNKEHDRNLGEKKKKKVKINLVRETPKDFGRRAT